jgi:F-type H+-transporting ATPase subunit b
VDLSFLENNVETNWPINLTLFMQVPIFIAFIWFMMKVIWPPLMKAIEERRAKIAAGLAAKERGRVELDAARKVAEEAIDQAKAHAAEIIANAQHIAFTIIDQAKNKALEETLQRTQQIEQQLKQEMVRVENELQQEIDTLARQCVDKILLF